MKPILKSLTTMLFTVFFLIAFTQETSAQCVTCKSTGGGFFCGPATNGGCQCATVGQQSDCVVSAPCARGTVCGQQGAAANLKVAGENQKNAGLKIDYSTIREIGKSHPRFAAMLATMNKLGGIKDWMQVHQTAAPIYAEDVENWLKPDKETQDFFRDYRKRQATGVERPVYEFTLRIIDDEHAVLQGKIIKGFDGDPAATNLEIELAKGKATDWKLY